MSMDSLKQNHFSNLNNSNNLSCTNLPFQDKSCNLVPNVKCPLVISTIENVQYNSMHREILLINVQTTRKWRPF